MIEVYKLPFSVYNGQTTSIVLRRKQKMKTVTIYALADPRNGMIRYVGKATNAKRRLQNHLTPQRLDNRTHRANWLRSLVLAGVRPTLSILEECSEEGWGDRERFWIDKLRGEGIDLVNTMPGGEGGATRYGHKPSEKTIAAIVAHAHNRKGKPGQPITEEHKRRISEKAKERWARWKAEGYKPGNGDPAERGKKISVSKKGQKPAPQTVAASVAARKGKPLSAEHREKLSVINTGKSISDEQKVNLSEAQRMRWANYTPEQRSDVGMKIREGKRKKRDAQNQ